MAISAALEKIFRRSSLVFSSRAGSVIRAGFSQDRMGIWSQKVPNLDCRTPRDDDTGPFMRVFQGSTRIAPSARHAWSRAKLSASEASGGIVFCLPQAVNPGFSDCGERHGLDIGQALKVRKGREHHERLEPRQGTPSSELNPSRRLQTGALIPYPFFLAPGCLRRSDRPEGVQGAPPNLPHFARATVSGSGFFEPPG